MVVWKHPLNKFRERAGVGKTETTKRQSFDLLASRGAACLWHLCGFLLSHSQSVSSKESMSSLVWSCLEGTRILRGPNHQSISQNLVFKGWFSQLSGVHECVCAYLCVRAHTHYHEWHWILQKSSHGWAESQDLGIGAFHIFWLTPRSIKPCLG